MANKPLAVYGICNTASLEIMEINEREEKVLVSFNRANATWRKLYYTQKGAYFRLDNRRYYLNEFMRV